jgi:hypothetical protein
MADVGNIIGIGRDEHREATSDPPPPIGGRPVTKGRAHPLSKNCACTTTRPECLYALFLFNGLESVQRTRVDKVVSDLTIS